MPGKFRALRILTITALLLLCHIAPAPAQEAPAAGPPYRVGGGVTRPEIVSQTRPVYTELARRAQVTGTVIVEAVIDELGNVTNVRVLKGLPMGLDRAAVEAIQNWKFKPATLEGRPVPVYYVLTINFHIDNASRYGPRFVKFLNENPEFAERLGGRRYEEAEALLQRWARERQDPEISLARTYLLLEQGRFNEAWQEALSYRGPDPYEVLHAVGLFAHNYASSDRPVSAKTHEIIELGLQAETMAMAAKPDGLDAIIHKRWLLREKAELTLDEEERRGLLEEAELLQKQAVELQHKLQGARPDGR